MFVAEIQLNFRLESVWISRRNREMRKDRFRDARATKGITQSDLADILGVDVRQISRWETGDTIPRGDAISRIADALETSTDYLLGNTDDPASNIRIDNLTDLERAVVIALRKGQDKEAIRLIASH